MPYSVVTLLEPPQSSNACQHRMIVKFVSNPPPPHVSTWGGKRKWKKEDHMVKKRKESESKLNTPTRQQPPSHCRHTVRQVFKTWTWNFWCNWLMWQKDEMMKQWNHFLVDKKCNILFWFDHWIIPKFYISLCHQHLNSVFPNLFSGNQQNRCMNVHLWSFHLHHLIVCKR